jgi:hypothetical protein
MRTPIGLACVTLFAQAVSSIPAAAQQPGPNPQQQYNPQQPPPQGYPQQAPPQGYPGGYPQQGQPPGAPGPDPNQQ